MRTKQIQQQQQTKKRTFDIADENTKIEHQTPVVTIHRMKNNGMRKAMCISIPILNFSKVQNPYCIQIA